jgi:hypothetical protein
MCDADSVRVLVKTGGDQFQFTRWYEFISSVFGLVETMGVDDKVAQIQTFRTQMRVLSGESVIDFDVPNSSHTPVGKRVRESAGAGEQPASKLLSLSAAAESYRPVGTKVDGSGARMMQQTMLVGQPSAARQSLSFDGGAVLEPRPPAPPPVNWFATPPDSVSRLCDYLLGRLPLYKQPSLVEVIETESKEDEFKRKKKLLNHVPNVMRAINRMLPSVITSSQASGRLPDTLQADRAFDLADLVQWFQQTSWSGVFTHFLPAYPVELTFGIGPETARRACFLELWRRALNLEGAMAKQAGYLRTLMECATSTVASSSAVQVPPSLSAVPLKIVGNIRALLSAGAGTFGSGAGFWDAKPDELVFLQCLPEGGAVEVVDLIKWLKGNREAAFEALYPQVDELSLIPTLALIFSLRTSLATLDSEDSRRQVLDALKCDHASRTQLYTQCLGRLVHYGARLTRYLPLASAVAVQCSGP